MNIAITGATGLLGAHLAAALSPRHRVVGFDRHAWWGTRPMALHRGDLTDKEQRGAFLEEAKPDMLIHCAAMVNVDACEERPADAFRANADLTKDLASAVPQGCYFVYVTTDGIFDGLVPWRAESDLPCPRTVYGRSKLQGEWEVQLSGRPYLIVRTNFFGWSSGRKLSAGERLWHQLEAQESLTLFGDFFFTPIYVVDLVARILALTESEASGIVHVVGGERVSKLTFGLALAAEAHFSTARVHRGSIDDATLIAPRPRDMSLRSDRLEALTGMAPPELNGGLRKFCHDRTLPLEARVAAVSTTDASSAPRNALKLP